MRNGFKRALCWGLSVTILLTPYLRPIQVSSQEPKVALSRAELRDIAVQRYEVISQLAASVPRETFDPQVIADQCAGEAGNIFSWVRDQTYLVPYRGLLRGHRGVLMDRRGNSLDRALLLAELLRRSGHEVRLARAQLTQDQAIKINDHARPYPAEGIELGAEITRDVMLSQIQMFRAIKGFETRKLLEFVDGHNLHRQQVAETTVQRVVEQTPQLAALVAGHRNRDASNDHLKESIQDFRDHWWVQKKRGDQWLDCDPTMPRAAIGDTITRADEVVGLTDDAKTLADAISPDLKHTLEVRVVIERWENGKLFEGTVLNVPLQPYQLSGDPIQITHVPVDWPLDSSWFDEDDPMGSFKRQVAGQWEWIPMLFIGNDLKAQSSFTIQGRVNPEAMALFRPPAEIAEATEGLTGAFNREVVGRMQAERKRPEQDRLTAEWIECVFHRPGQPPRTVRREVFDLLGPATRDAASQREIEIPKLTEEVAQRRGFAVLGVTEFLPLTHNISPHFVRHLAVTRDLANRDPIMTSLQPGAKSLPFRWMPTPGMLYEFALARQRYNLHRHRVYLGELNLLTFRHEITVNEQGQIVGGEGFDILANNVAMHPSADLDPFDLHLQQGIMDTVLEAALLEDRGHVSNTSTLFEHSGGASDQWVVIDQEDAAAFASLDVNPDTRSRIRRDLGDGFLVVVDATARFGKDSAVGWWRVDPVTGDTLGMMESGRGEGYLEYVFISALIVVCNFQFVLSIFTDLPPWMRICARAEEGGWPDDDLHVPTVDDPNPDDPNPGQTVDNSSTPHLIVDLITWASGGRWFWESVGLVDSH